MDRVQYKKAMDDYNATLSDSDSVDAPVAKQTKVIEIKDEISATNPIPGSCHDVITKKKWREIMAYEIAPLFCSSLSEVLRYCYIFIIQFRHLIFQRKQKILLLSVRVQLALWCPFPHREAVENLSQ